MSVDKAENSGATILVVDDEPLIVEVLKVLLLKAGHAVVTATSGKEAIAVAVASNPDLILMDIAMPVMDGYEATLYVKRHPSLRQTPVIFLSGRSKEEDGGRAFAVGASMFLRKPFKAKLVIDAVNLALRLLHQPTPVLSLTPKK